MSDDTPTERLAEATEDPAEERTKSRALMIALIAIAALLLIGLIVLLVLLFTRPGDAVTPTPTDTEITSATPTDSATPTESSTPTPTSTTAPTPAPPPPADTAPGFASFAQGQTVSCNSTNPPGYTPPGITFSYTAKNASSVWFVFGESDAADAGAFPMPLSGNQDDVYGSGTPVEYPCGAEEARFTLTVVGTSGQHVNRTFTVRNNGDVY